VARSWKKLYAQYNAGVGPASIALAIFGLLTLLLWYLTRDESTMSTILMLAGISIVVLACMLYMLSPPRYLQSETADAIALSNTLNVHKLLSLLLIESKGIYVPADDTGLMRVFIPISKNGEMNIGSLRPGNETLSVSSSGVKGISLTPPGYELFRYAQSIGMSFTRENMETKIQDVMENGMELASSVKITSEGDRIHVTMRNITDRDLCNRIRIEAPGICSRIGCPVCSCVACMIAKGTGRSVRIESVSVDGNTINMAYELV
jgi:hypothetical protein